MNDTVFLRQALRLAQYGYGTTSPNPMVGAVLAQGGKVIGRGWHRRAGEPHAEIEVLRAAQKHGRNPKGATLYVTLEPCCTHGRTPPCTDAILAAGIKRVVVGTLDPNPPHAGEGLKILQRAGIKVTLAGQEIAEACARLNDPFNHWIIQRTPFVTVKAAMTLDGKIATASGQSKWITGERARAFGMHLRQGADAILAGVNTILADDPALTVRKQNPDGSWRAIKPIRRIILDSLARTPLTAKVVSDEFAALTTVVVTQQAPKKRVKALACRVNVLTAPGNSSQLKTQNSKPPAQNPKPNLRWLLQQLGAENVTHLLVEGGGEVNASFLLSGLAHRVAFFYAPKILGGRDARLGVAGDGILELRNALPLADVEWQTLGEDLLLQARVVSPSPRADKKQRVLDKTRLD